MASPTSHILVFRFSALGDVAMTVPVIKLLLQQHPGLHVTVVSQPMMRPLFDGIDRLHFYPADIKKKFKGIKGLFALSRQLKKDIPYTAIADLHDVVRTKLLRFFLMGKKVAVIDKGRKEKEELTRPVNKDLRQLKTTFQRYADVFEKLRFPVRLIAKEGIVHRTANPNLLPGKVKDRMLIGIAPFAKHAAKMYTLSKMKDAVRLFSQHAPVNVLLFGSATEASELEQWERQMPNVYSLGGKMKFDDELSIISQLDVMISMDSANMHLASLYGIPVVSIWGGTHPFLGFYGWGQDPGNALQQDLPCRPSSVFGNKSCPVHGKQGCMTGITPLMVYDKVKSLLKW